ECIKSDGRVLEAGCVVQERLTTVGSIEKARRVEAERRQSDRGIVAAIVKSKRRLSKGGVAGAGGVAQDRKESECGVVDACGVVEECARPSGGIPRRVADVVVRRACESWRGTKHQAKNA